MLQMSHSNFLDADYVLHDTPNWGFIVPIMDDEFEGMVSDELRLPKEFWGIGGKLRHARVNAGFSRAKLAKMAGVSPSSLTNWELSTQEGGKYPPLLKLVRLCQILKIDPRELFDIALDEVDPDRGALVQDEERGVKYWDEFRFTEFFATDTDWANWKLEVKQVEDLENALAFMSHQMHLQTKYMQDIAKRLSAIENGPDHEDPSRSNSNNSTSAAPTASNHQPNNEKDDQK